MRVPKQRITLFNLIKRNAEAERLANHTPPSPESIINLPFILVRTNQDTFIECEMTPERCVPRLTILHVDGPPHPYLYPPVLPAGARACRSNEYHFSLTAPFEIHDDIEVLRRMGLNHITPAEIDAMIPPAMRPFLPDYVQLTPGTDAFCCLIGQGRGNQLTGERQSHFRSSMYAENADVPVIYEPQPPAPVLTTPSSSPMRGPFSSPSTSVYAPSSPHGVIPSSSPVRSPLKPN